MRIEGATVTPMYPSQNTSNPSDTANSSVNHQQRQVVSEEPRQQMEEKDVFQAIERANKEFKAYNRRLEFSIHEATNEIVVKVVDTKDDHVIREIPSEKILDMVAKMCEMAGLFVDEKR